MSSSTLFLVFCIVGLTLSCMPTRPPDPGIPVTRSPTNPKATTQPGTITEAPVTQAPVTEAPVTEPPIPCKSCKAADLVLDDSGPYNKPYSSIMESEVDGCTQLEVICEVGDGYTCNSPLALYARTVSGYNLVGSLSDTRAAGFLTCGSEGSWMALAFGNLEPVLKYYCYENECSNG